MGKKSRKWIKANAETAAQIDVARARRARDERTGGSLKARAASELFVLDKTPGGSAPARKRDRMLHVERVLQPNPHIKPVKLEKPRSAKKPPLKMSKVRAARRAGRGTGRVRARVECAGAVRAAAHRSPTPNRPRARAPRGALRVTVQSAPKRAPVPQPKRKLPVQYGFDAWGDGGAEEAAEPAAAQAEAPPLAPPARPRPPPTPEPSLVPAVEVAAPGLSYNPTPEAHQAALRTALASELRRQRKGVQYAGERPRNVESIDQIGDVAGADEAEEEGADAPGRAPHREVERKTKAERNRLQRKRATRRAVEAAARQRALDKQLKRVQQIAKELSAEEKARAAEKAAKPVPPEKVAGVPKRLGRVKRKADPWRVLLSDELPSSLRALPAPPTDLLAERLRNATQRNLVEARLPVRKRRKYERKTYTKKGFKEEDWQNIAS